MRIGEVTAIMDEEKYDIEWKIQDFLSLSKEVDSLYCSPNFSFEGDNYWYMMIWSNVIGDRSFIHLRLRRVSNGPPINMQFSFSFKTLNGQKDSERWRRAVFKGRSFHDIDRFISHSDFEKRQSEFVASGSLTVVCTMKRIASIGSATECSYCNDIFDEILSHEKKCRIKCPECLDIILLKNWQDHECQISRTKAVEKLFDDLKGMMVSGDNSDTTIIVKKEEFRLHRNILGARNPYFNSMFNSNMKENITGIVAIDDCEPDIFRLFIQFIYTGKVDCLSSENVYDLYEVADKYQENHLKEQCLQFMMNSIFPENVCFLYEVSDMYQENHLKEQCLQFMMNLISPENVCYLYQVSDMYQEKQLKEHCLQFMMNSISLENACVLYEVSDKYQENQLKEQCLQFMMNSISVDSFCDFYTVALKHEEKELLSNAKKFFASKTEEITCSEKWALFLTDYPEYANELRFEALYI